HRHHAVEQLSTLPRRHACHDLGAVADHLARVERAVAAGDSLDQEARALVDEDAHAARARATACCTASSMSVSAGNRAAVMMRSAATTFCGLELPPMSRKLAGAPP